MFIPINLHYTSNHLWLRDVGRQDAYVGITDFAQKELGRIDSLEIQRGRNQKKRGETFGIIYGANKCFELIMPFTGCVIVNNSEIQKDPGILNSDPYHYWIVLLSTTTSLEDKIPTYFSSKDYQIALNGIKRQNDI